MLTYLSITLKHVILIYIKYRYKQSNTFCTCKFIVVLFFFVYIYVLYFENVHITNYKYPGTLYTYIVMLCIVRIFCYTCFTPSVNIARRIFNVYYICRYNSSQRYYILHSNTFERVCICIIPCSLQHSQWKI